MDTTEYYKLEDEGHDLGLFAEMMEYLKKHGSHVVFVCYNLIKFSLFPFSYVRATKIKDPSEGTGYILKVFIQQEASPWLGLERRAFYEVLGGNKDE